MSAPPSDVKLALQRTSSTLLQQIEALEKRTSELKRSREASQENDKNDEDILEKENKEEKKNSKAAEDSDRDTPDGKSEDEDRSKLPQVVGDENKKAILQDPRGWARERLATALREKGKDLEQKENRSRDEQTKSGEGDGMNIVPPSTPGTIAKAAGMPGMMKGSAPNPMSMGAVAKGASLPPLAPLSMPAMPPFQAKGAMPCGLGGPNGSILPKALGPKMPGMPGLDLPCGGALPGCMGNMGPGCGGCGMGGSMGSGPCGGPDKGKGEGGDVQDQVMLQMQMQMQMMMMGAMMGSMLGEGDEKKAKKRKKDKKNEDDDLPPGPSSDMSHPSYRPPDMEHMPGITDRRFEGRITSWFEDKGYGFIGNEELKQRFNGMDVFLQTNQKRHFEQGDFVAFSVFKNKRGQPQATELRGKNLKKSK